MNIFKNRIHVDTYLDAERFVWNHNFEIYYKNEKSDDIDKNKAIIEQYRKENFLNPFKFFNERFRPYIDYGLKSQITGKLIFISLFFFFISIFSTMFLKSLFVFIYLFSVSSMMISLFLHQKYRDKYEIAKEKYEKEKKNPNWRRKQIMNRLLKD